MVEVAVALGLLVVLSLSLRVLHQQENRHKVNIDRTDDIIGQLKRVVRKLEEAVTSIESEDLDQH